MFSFKKAVFALGLGIGLSFAMNVGAAPGCLSCQNMGNLCDAGDEDACYHFEALGCARYGQPGGITCAA
jgi:hypothetical protein